MKLYLSEHDGRLHIDVSRTIAPVFPSSTTESVSLEEILCNKDNLSNLPTQWKINQRMVLAFRLASALLQYHSTPWLRHSWSKKEIYFPCSDSQTPAPDGSFLFEADHPFINHVFTSCPEPEATHPLSAKQLVLELGIILLEIWHVMAFEAYIASENMTIDGTYGSRYNAAKKWLNDTANNILPFYLDATCRCIEGTLSCSSPMLDWNDVQFRRSICEEVVKPLWENCAPGLR